MQGLTRVLLLAIYLARTSLSQNCIPLRQCSSMMTLLENKNQLSGHQVDTIDIFTTLRTASCGFEGNDPLVWCQDSEVEDGDENVDRGVIINRDIAPELHCDGILTLMHLNPSQGLGSIKTSRLQGRIYLNTQRRMLQNRKILHFKVDGNCCWKLHTRQNFRGSSEYLYPDHEGTFESLQQPKSIKRILCSTVSQLK